MHQPLVFTTDTPQPHGWYLYTLKLIETGLRQSLDAALADHGFSTAQYTALSVLQVRPGITSSELARRSFVKAQSMAETVSSLLGRGLVNKEQDPSHARRLLLRLSPAGEQALQEVEQPVAQLEAAILDGLGDNSRSHLASALRTLRQNLLALSEAPFPPSPIQHQETS